MFDKNLAKSDEIGRSPVHDSVHNEAQSPNVDGPFARSTRALISQLASDTRDSIKALDDQNRTAATRTVQRAVRTSNRPTRSTKPTESYIDAKEHDDDDEVDKFSINVGLGQPWAR